MPGISGLFFVIIKQLRFFTPFYAFLRFLFLLFKKKVVDNNFMDKTKLKKLLIGAALVAVGVIIQKKYSVAEKIPVIKNI